MTTTSAPVSMPLSTASNATDAGSAPSAPRTTSAPTRDAQLCSWSAAAARKVSAAPSTTRRPSATRTRASLPTVVVLPVPLTPTTSSTDGLVVVRQRPDRAVQVGLQLGDQDLAQHGAGVGLGAHAGRWPCVGAQRGDHRLGDDRTEVGDQQGVLDVLPGVLVEVTAAEQAEHAAAERVLRLGQPSAQPLEPAVRRGDGSIAGRRVRATVGSGSAAARRRRFGQLQRRRSAASARRAGWWRRHRRRAARWCRCAPAGSRRAAGPSQRSTIV